MAHRTWREALGKLDGEPAGVRAWLTDGGFDRLPASRPREWRTLCHEPGQTFEEFVTAVSRPEAIRRVIYLQPYDDLTGLSDTCRSLLAAFVSAFFGLPVRVLPDRPMRPGDLTPRRAPDTGGWQVSAAAVLQGLRADRPPDAFCVLGLTAQDLYPSPLISFSFGTASPSCRVGVCSVARFGPPFCEDVPGERQGAMRRRCCRVLAHEIGHIAGLAHCVYFRCLMNGSANPEESERRPLHLCPVDLRKLHWLLGFDLAGRYAALDRFWRAAGDPAEADWAHARLSAGSWHPAATRGTLPVG